MTNEREQAIAICVSIQQELRRLAYLTRNHGVRDFVDAMFNDISAIESALTPVSTRAGGKAVAA